MNNNWTRDELIVALNLYCKLGFTKVKYTHPNIEELSKVLGRSPSAVAYKLVNFARLDPELQKRGVKGMSHGSKGEEVVWNEFYNDFERLAQVSEPLLAQFKKIPLEESIEIDISDLPKEGKEREAIMRVRVNQCFFRAMVLGIYKRQCCITGISTPSLLLAGHILPWARNRNERMNPSNGLCMNLLHDRAFETGLIGITPDYRIKISKEISSSKSKEAIEKFFLPFDNKEINLPQRFLPDKKFLEQHYETVFKK